MRRVDVEPRQELGHAADVLLGEAVALRRSVGLPRLVHHATVDGRRAHEPKVPGLRVYAMEDLLHASDADGFDVRFLGHDPPPAIDVTRRGTPTRRADPANLPAAG